MSPNCICVCLTLFLSPVGMCVPISVCVCQSACLLACLPTCLLACLPACLLACLPALACFGLLASFTVACFSACLFASSTARLLTSNHVTKSSVIHIHIMQFQFQNKESDFSAWFQTVNHPRSYIYTCSSSSGKIHYP